jgi:molybdenum cofactor cytidylyltransferase
VRAEHGEAVLLMSDVEAVVLAAGLSSRCKEYKLSLPLGGRSLIEQTVRRALEHAAHVYVVIGHQDEVVRGLLAGYERVTCVLNEDYALGMFSSVRVGLAQVRAERILFTPGDIPLVSAEVYAALLASQAPVAIPTYQGRKGHPVFLTRPVVAAALAAPPEATLRDVLSAFDGELVPVADETILLDVDTLEDYQRAVRLLTARERA